MTQQAQGHDVVARWKGPLGKESKKALKAWIAKLGSQASVAAKIGKDRSRVSVDFDRGELSKQARSQIERICALMEAGAGEGGEEREWALALRELAAREVCGSAGSISLKKDCEGVALREKAAECVRCLNALLAEGQGLQIELGEAVQSAPDYPAEKIGRRI